MSFVRGKANATAEDRTQEFSTIIFLSDLREEEDFNARAISLSGIEAIRAPVYSLNTIVGFAIFMFVHDSNNIAAYYYHWEGEAGVSTPVVRGEVRTSWTRADTPMETQRTGCLLYTSPSPRD